MKTIKNRSWIICFGILGITFFFLIFIPYFLVMLHIPPIGKIFTEEVLLIQIILYILCLFLAIVFVYNYGGKIEASDNDVQKDKKELEENKDKNEVESFTEINFTYCQKCGYDIRQKKGCPICGWRFK